MKEAQKLTLTFHTLSENAEGTKFVGYTIESDGVKRFGGHVALGGTLELGVEIRTEAVFSERGSKLERLKPFIRDDE